MEYRLYRVGAGVVLLILEMFIMSFDALALSLAAFVTAGLCYALGIEMIHWQQGLVIFLIASVLALILVRLLLVPRLQGPEVTNPMSGDTIVGKEFVVQKINGREVIKHEGMYWNVVSDGIYKVGDTVVVQSMDDNLVKITKK